MGNEMTPADCGEPVKIRNKDIPLLADIFTIMQDIRQIEERREWQKGRMFNITQHLTGMPGGGGMPKGLDEAFAQIKGLLIAHCNWGIVAVAEQPGKNSQCRCIGDD